MEMRWNDRNDHSRPPYTVCVVLSWSRSERGVRHSASRSTRFRNPLDFTWILENQIGFVDFTWISGFQSGFLDFTVDFRISKRISGFQSGFLHSHCKNYFVKMTICEGYCSFIVH